MPSVAYLSDLRSALADALASSWDGWARYLQELLDRTKDDDAISDGMNEYDDADFSDAVQSSEIQVPLQNAYRMGFLGTMLQLGALGSVAATIRQWYQQQQKKPSVGVPPPPSPPKPTGGAGRHRDLEFQVVWGLQNNLAQDYARDRAAEMVGKRRLPDGSLQDNPNAKWQISQTTRDKLKELVNQAFQDNKSYRDIKASIEALPGWNNLFGEYRAEMIARTELGLCQNAGILAGYKAKDIKQVRVHDGTDFDDACRSANGQVWDLDYALAHPLAHPNCTRSFSSAWEK